MKKLLLILSASLAFVSCSGKKSSGSLKMQRTGLSNPVVSADTDFIKDRNGFTFSVPEMAEEVSYSVISDEVFQMDFYWSTIKCTARFKKASRIEDISGFYYGWEKIFHEPLFGNTAEEKYVTDSDGNIQAVCLWFDEKNGFAWSFSMTVPGLGPGETEDVKNLAMKLSAEVTGCAEHGGLTE